METASFNNGTRYYIMAVTPTRLYSFTGTGSPEVSQLEYVNVRAIIFYMTHVILIFTDIVDHLILIFFQFST